MLRETLGRRTSDNTEATTFFSSILVHNSNSATTAMTQEEIQLHHHNSNNNNNDSNSNNNLNDDIFGSPPGSPLLSTQDAGEGRIHDREHHHFHSDITHLRNQHVTAGYRDGIAAAKESHVQAGFDEGYSLGGEVGRQAGWVVGVVEGMVRAVLGERGGGGGGGKEEGKEDEGSLVMTEEEEELREEVLRTWKEVREELRMEKLLGEEWFGGEDGVWKFEVPGDEEGDHGEVVTFEVVAEAHPVLRKWRARVRELGAKLGIQLWAGEDDGA